MPNTPSAFSRLNRALFWTHAVMVWERILPVFVPFPLLALLVAVAGQWGLFLVIPAWAHVAILVAGLLIAIYAAARSAMAFRKPTFTEVNNRLAVDNDLRPEQLLGMRHSKDQPKLRIGKAKAGIAKADPFALRFVALAMLVLGLLILGPSSVYRMPAGFCPFAIKAPVSIALNWR